MAERRNIDLHVNGRAVRAEVEPRTHLGDFLRHHLGLTGTHMGCEHGVCGACTVLVDGEAVRSCLMFSVQANGRQVTTVEGLSTDGALHPIQAALKARHGLQCGFCTPGILTTLVAFLRDTPDPTEEEVRVAISGNICRCTGYQPIVDAALDVARAAKGGGQ